MAEDKEIPLLERIRFLAIFTSNLDEFFMVRVASLKRKIEAGVGNVNSAGFVPREQMKVLLKRTHELVERQSKCFHSELIPELSKIGVNFLTWDELTESELVYLQDLFTSKIYPVFHYVGVKKHGIGKYIKDIMFMPGVPKAAYILITPLELLTFFLVRPLTLSLRLFANMFAGHLLLLVFILGGEHLLQGVIGLKLISPFAFSIGIVLTFFEFMVQCLQAYIFTLLTALYIAGALADEH